MSRAGFFNLPHPLTRLVGRGRELQTIAACLREGSSSLVTLTGPGGIGKTRLAIEVAGAVGRDFSDGVAFVDLAPLTDPASVPAAIATVLEIVPTVEQRLDDQLAEYLADLNLLLILDNVEHLPSITKLVARLLANSHYLQILATSRDRLSLRGERLIEVEPLSLPDPARSMAVSDIAGSDAVCLFVERARAVRADFALTESNATAVAAICAHLDGLPLAIELAAARSRILSPSALLARLGEALSLLGRGSDDLPARHQTMWEAVAWSYNQLKPDEQTMFRRLAVFSGGWSLEAAEYVVGDGPVPYRSSAASLVVDALESLLTKSLIRRKTGRDEEDRFTLFETIREFGLAQIRAQDDEEAIRWRHVAYCLDFARRAEESLRGPHQAVWMQRIEADLENMRSALRWSIDQGASGAETALQLATSLWWFWNPRGYLSEADTWLAHALELTEGTVSATRGRALLYRGNGVSGDPARARDFYQQSFDVFAQLDDLAGMAAARGSLGQIAAQLGEYDEARHLYDESLAIYRNLGATVSIVAMLHRLARLAIDEAHLATAQRRLQEALAAVQDVDARAWLHLDRGRIARLEQRFDAAQDLLMLSLADFEAVGDAVGVWYVAHEFALIALQRGQIAAAMASLHEALAQCRELGIRDEITARLLEGVATVAGAGRCFSPAVRLWGAATRWRSTSRLPLPQAEQQELDRQRSKAGAELGQRTFLLEWQRGELMTLDAAIDLALSLQGLPATDQLDATAPRLAVVPAATNVLASLTPREREVLCEMMDGSTDREIGGRLGMSSRTTETHVNRILRKLELKNRAAAAAFAVRHGVCPNEPTISGQLTG